MIVLVFVQSFCKQKVEEEVTQPQPIRIEEVQRIALEKGSERRIETARRIGGFFGGIKEKITKGVDFVLGSPEAATYLGTEATELGKEKAKELRDSIAEAGIRAWESIVDAEDRLEKRSIDTKNRLIGRCEQIKNATQERAVNLTKKAAVFGLEKIAEPIEGRLQKIYEVPADIRDWQSRRAEASAKKQEIRASLLSEAAEERVNALKARISEIQESTNGRIDSLNGLRDSALVRSSELNNMALARREQSRQNFGKARAAVQSLQTR